MWGGFQAGRCSLVGEFVEDDEYLVAAVGDDGTQAGRELFPVLACGHLARWHTSPLDLTPPWSDPPRFTSLHRVKSFSVRRSDHVDNDLLGLGLLHTHVDAQELPNEYVGNGNDAN